MASCEQGYLCVICGDEVAEITESELYLRYVIGEIAAAELSGAAERHLRCNPSLAQFIVDPDFEPVVADGPFDKRTLDPEHVAERERLVTRGWRRLRELAGSQVPIAEYPLSRVEEAT